MGICYRFWRRIFNCPQKISLSGAISSGKPTFSAKLRVINPRWIDRFRQRFGR